MASDLMWTHHFCLACDKQTDGATYCSESCRLSDYDPSSSATSSGESSPAINGPSTPWPFSNPAASSTKFYLAPAYDFSNARPYGSPSNLGALRSSPLTAAQQHHHQRSQSLLAPPARMLSPSSSHTSLCSVQSTASFATDASQLSDKTRRELRAYAVSFEQVRMQRRRSH